MMISEPLPPFPHLKALCVERGIEATSFRQACYDLGIRLDWETSDDLKIQIHRSLWSDNYLARGRLTAEIEAAAPHIQSWVKKNPPAQKGSLEPCVQNFDSEPDKDREWIVLSLELLSARSLPLDWQAVLTRLLTRTRPQALRPKIWEFIGSQLYLWVGKDRASFQEIVMTGWSLLDIFGCHKTKPENRIDCKGLILLLEGKTVLGVSADRIELKTASGAIQSYYKSMSLLRGSDQITLDQLS